MNTANALKPCWNLPLLLENNEFFAREYGKNPLMQLITSDVMKKKHVREQLLDCIQVFSDYFQKVVMLRYVFCEDFRFHTIAQEHLREEYGHNVSLNQDRQHRPSIWDSVLEASSAWFSWKMFTVDSEEKTVLIHLVLEASAKIFFTQAHRVMDQHQETQYFKIHDEADKQHEQMGIVLLENLSAERYQRLQEIQIQGWKMLNTACERIAVLTNRSVNDGISLSCISHQAT